MQDLPHHYRVEARAGPEGDATLSAEGLPPLASQPPAQFGGPGDRWSPETLLLAALADCYALSFRVLANNSKVGFRELRCQAEGGVDRAEGALRFTRIRLDVELELGPEANADRARRLLERAKQACLVSNSLSAPLQLEARIREAGV